jgi:spermidine/putrescine transport system permease protein
MDKRLLEAASDLGAGPLTAFRKITLPLTMPGVAAGSILVFISSLGMFVVPDIMGGAKSSLMGNVIQNQFLSARDWPFGSGSVHHPGTAQPHHDRAVLQGPAGPERRPPP